MGVPRLVARRLAVALVAVLPSFAAEACARVSGLDELVKDDCAKGACGDATRRDAQRDGQAAKDVDAAVAEAGPPEVVCGATTCAPERGCCLGDAGAPTCIEANGTCLGLIARCDSHDDCLALGENLVCCASQDVVARTTGIFCESATTCKRPVCASGPPTCKAPRTCIDVAPGAPLACAAPDGG